MSSISRLEITAVRNINVAKLEPGPSLNLLYGENGSGKTSVLEALHLLATGRSFRSAHTDQLINYAAKEAVVFAQLDNGHSAGMSRGKNERQQLKFDDQVQRNWDIVARALPVQVLDASSFLLLEGGPKARRRFLDWGVFHLEPTFVENWRRTRKCIANRNNLLKRANPDRSEISAWDRELSSAATLVDEARESYLTEFLPVFADIYKELAGDHPQDISLSYHRGWEKGKSLELALSQSISQDLRYKATQHGPHRADIDLKIGSRKALEVLSRGQQKILVSALKLAQGKLLSSVLGSHCIYLVDDLPSELDKANRASVLTKLIDLESQLFITCVELEAVTGVLPSGCEMATFHVERGTITT
jgi:DNA replication and repair protein RecF